MAEDVCWNMMPVHQLAGLLLQGIEKRLIIDSRSFLEFNTCHINESVNASSSKLIKRRLQQDKLSVRELLTANCQVDMDVDYDIIVYDQCTSNPSLLSVDCFLVILVMKLQKEFRNVFLLKGGFLEFQSTHPSLCNSQGCSTSSGNYKCPPMTSMSQPCMPVSNVGPTKIVPFLFLGSQQDALSQETMKQNGINYILNVSTTSPRPSFVQEGHFLRIPVNDSYCDKLIPHFEEAFLFIDKVREANECVLVHCLAGISRSPTLAIAYIMKYLHLTTDEAYKYVKDKRPTISPNFNFLGQLLEYERLLHNADRSAESAEVADDMVYAKKQCIVDLLSPASPSVGRGKMFFAQKPSFPLRPMSLHSPTAALSKLNFNQPSPVIEVPSPFESPAQSNGDDVQLSLDNVIQLPTALLDQISFTPCFAGVESTDSCKLAPSFDGGFHSFSDLSSVACDAPILLGNSDMTSKQWLRSEVAAEMNCSPNLKRGKTFADVVSGSLKVIIRSQDNCTKRHLVRPNSIAFSSYPRRDSLARNNSHTKESCMSNAKVNVGNVAQNIDGTLVVLEEPHSPSKLPITLVNGDHDARQNLDQYRKSRSLEDILISPDEQDSGVLNHLKELEHGCLPNTAEMLSPTSETTTCRWQGTADRNQSSGNISSSSSQNSVHEGLEVIEVI